MENMENKKEFQLVVKSHPKLSIMQGDKLDGEPSRLMHIGNN